MKIQYSAHSASALILIKSDISGYVKASHASRESDGGRDSQCTTVDVDGKYGYVRDGKPVCLIWSDHLHLAQKGEETQKAYPTIPGLSFANHLKFRVYPFDLIMLILPWLAQGYRPTRSKRMNRSTPYSKEIRGERGLLRLRGCAW